MKTIRQNFFLLLFLITASFASAQVPVLSSYPAAQNVVFLDFDGHIVDGTAWNGSGPIVCDAATLNAAQITAIFNRVAEDYRPFTVNVTTDSAKYDAAPATHRMRVVLTVSSSWYGSAGGVSFINSFTWGDNTPCFVFTALLNNNTKYIAEAASHEIGHTLGLRHQSLYDAQCNKVAEYYSGLGTGEIAWAPIMGVGYYRNMTLWHYGSDPYGCNDMQDDLAVITGNDNGIGFRNDDHGNTTAGATVASISNNAFQMDGLIEQPGDVDVVKFTTAANGRFTLDASPFSIATGNTGADIDLQVELLNSTEGVIGVYNAANTLNAAIDTTLSAGTYYLRVQGKGNAYAPAYASLGSYTLKANLTPGNLLPVHKLQLQGAAEAKQHKLAWEVVADETIVSQTIEAATDGNGFTPMATTDATVRSYTYSPAGTGIVYYRLSVLFDNGRRYNSNIIALRNAEKTLVPALVGNIINGTITVSSPSAYSYTIVDMTGRIVCKGSLVQGLNVLSPQLTTNGLYLIQFDNGVDRRAGKFTKQ